MSFLTRFQTKLESLYSLSENSKYVIAYSGGVDSHVLLHCCVKLKLPVRAVHVHHGLQSVADEWVVHCQTICKQLDIALDVVYVDAEKKSGESPEESARNARYEGLRKGLQADDCLITAQHQNDQAETLLLQLFRTASAAGLSAMPEKKLLAGYHHIRPLLSFTRQELVSFAEENNLHWVEDPSNQDVNFDRNHLRQNVLPLLQNRWPQIVKQLSAVATMQSANLRVLEDMAAIDLANVIASPKYQSTLYSYEPVSVLSIDALRQMSTERLANLLRYWVITKTKLSPTKNLLLEIERTIVHAKQDTNPVIEHSGFECRKHQDGLYLLKRKVGLDTVEDVSWDASSPLVMESLKVRLTAVNKAAAGLKLALLDESLKVCFRKGGENFHPEHRQHSQSLKKLLQEEGVPPWERNTLPLLYLKDECIAVVGLWIAKGYAVDVGEDGWVVDVEVLTDIC